MSRKSAFQHHLPALALVVSIGAGCTDPLTTPVDPDDPALQPPSEGCITVDGQGAYDTVQDAVEAAVDGSEIVLCAGTFRGGTLLTDKSVTVVGAGLDQTALDGEDAILFDVRRGTLTLSDVRLRSRRATVRVDTGGLVATRVAVDESGAQALWSLNSDLTLTDVDLAGGATGGARFSGGTITWQGGAITDHSAYGLRLDGGAVATLSDLSIDGVVATDPLIDDVAGWGVRVIRAGTQVTLTNTTLTNVPFGIAALEGTEVQLDGVQLTGADVGVQAQGASLSGDGTTITGHTIAALQVDEQADVAVTDWTIDGAGTSPLGVDLQSGTLTMIDSELLGHDQAAIAAQQTDEKVPTSLTLTGVVVRNSARLGLDLLDVDASLSNTTLEAITQPADCLDGVQQSCGFGVRVEGGTLRLADSAILSTPWGLLGKDATVLVADDNADGLGLLVQDAGEVAVQLSEGTLGGERLQIVRAGRVGLSLSDGADATMQALRVDGGTFTSTIEGATGKGLLLTEIDNQGVDVLVDDATATLTDVLLVGGDTALSADGSTVVLTGGTVTGHRSQGLRVVGGSLTVQGAQLAEIAGHSVFAEQANVNVSQSSFLASARQVVTRRTYTDGKLTNTEVIEAVLPTLRARQGSLALSDVAVSLSESAAVRTVDSHVEMTGLTLQSVDGLTGPVVELTGNVGAKLMWTVADSTLNLLGADGIAAIGGPSTSLMLRDVVVGDPNHVPGTTPAVSGVGVRLQGVGASLQDVQIGGTGGTGLVSIGAGLTTAGVSVASTSGTGVSIDGGTADLSGVTIVTQASADLQCTNAPTLAACPSVPSDRIVDCTCP